MHYIRTLTIIAILIPITPRCHYSYLAFLNTSWHFRDTLESTSHTYHSPLMNTCQDSNYLTLRAWSITTRNETETWWQLIRYPVDIAKVFSIDAEKRLLYVGSLPFDYHVYVLIVNQYCQIVKRLKPWML